MPTKTGRASESRRMLTGTLRVTSSGSAASGGPAYPEHQHVDRQHHPQAAGHQHGAGVRRVQFDRGGVVVQGRGAVADLEDHLTHGRERGEDPEEGPPRREEQVEREHRDQQLHRRHGVRRDGEHSQPAPGQCHDQPDHQRRHQERQRRGHHPAPGEHRDPPRHQAQQGRTGSPRSEPRRLRAHGAAAVIGQLHPGGGQRPAAARVVAFQPPARSAAVAGGSTRPDRSQVDDVQDDGVRRGARRRQAGEEGHGRRPRDDPAPRAACRPGGSRRPSPVESCSLRVIPMQREPLELLRAASSPRAPWCQPCAEESPVALTRRTSKSRATRLRTMEAATPHRASPSRSRRRSRGGRSAGCRSAACSATATAAPRGAPSARRRWRCWASGSGAGRRRGGTPGWSRRGCRRRAGRGCGCRPRRPTSR